MTANIKKYTAESIINWSTSVIDGKKILSQVVLKESVEKSLDGFEFTTTDQYRVLKLTQGRYIVQIWREGELYEALEPRLADGSFFTEIPFIIAGTYSNDADVDDASLYDIAELNIGHYRNSASYEESVFIVGQPQPVISGLTKSWIDSTGGQFKFGSRVAWALPEGGSGELLQVQPNSMAMEAMMHKEKQMISIGARLVQPSGQAETAEAARIKYAGDTSLLSYIVSNASDALSKAITWCGLYMGSDGGRIDINQDFYDKTIDPQKLMADIQLLDRGVIAKYDVRTKLRKSGDIDINRTDEEIDAEVGDINPL